MNYRRVLLLVDLESDAHAALDLVRLVAPRAELLLIVVRAGSSPLAWLTAEAPPDLNDAATASLEELKRSASGLAESVEIHVETDAGAGSLTAIAAAAGIDLLVTGSLYGTGELRRARPLPVLWTASGTVPAGAIENILCLALGDRARRAVARFLRDHGAPPVRVTALLDRVSDVGSLLEVAGVKIDVDVHPVTRPPAGEFQLLVVARLASAFVAARKWRVPVLILPPLESGPPATERAMDIADVADENGVIRLAAHYAIDVGRREPIADQDLAVVSGGRVVATIATEDGGAELTPAPPAAALGIYRTAGRAGADPVASIEQQVAVIRPGSRPLLLFDSSARETELGRLSGIEGADLLAVRMRVTENAAAIRARMAKAGIPPLVIDARAVLDEGSALDVGDDTDAVRLARVGTRMRGAGFPVAAIVYRGAVAPSTVSFAAFRAGEIPSRIEVEPPSPAGSSLSERLDATTGAPLIAGNRIEVELDNGTARRWLIDSIGRAQRRVHLQIYMALDDDVGSAVEAALAAAGTRGVTVRVLVDSLHGLHGSAGLRNPLLERLGKRPGVELRVIDPITGAPSLHDLKQRDHRKAAIIDGEIALIGGRNLSHEYYAGFDEVRLTKHSLWREVPWLDAGVRVEGPAVAVIDRCFLEAWTASGGAPFEIEQRPPAGTSAVRVVTHHGLRDARTLDAYVTMIDSARSHVYTVNGFPLILEIQHALLRALRRGVRVRTLFGNLTPTHDGVAFHGPWSTARTEATQLVHSRMDALVAAGADAHQFAVPHQAQWEAGLGTIHPHVHAKVMSADGRVCSVGSANLDVTAGYWENEMILVVEDRAIASALEARIDSLLAQSPSVNRDDPAWRKLARRREWMRRWPGVMSV
jgi:phosphatidylserine/phosphatidylglycerophosphate/cardiolipin synthase-like enzyme